MFLSQLNHFRCFESISAERSCRDNSSNIPGIWCDMENYGKEIDQLNWNKTLVVDLWACIIVLFDDWIACCHGSTVLVGSVVRWLVAWRFIRRWWSMYRAVCHHQQYTCVLPANDAVYIISCVSPSFSAPQYPSSDMSLTPVACSQLFMLARPMMSHDLCHGPYLYISCQTAWWHVCGRRSVSIELIRFKCHVAFYATEES